MVFEVFWGVAPEGQKVLDSLNRLAADHSETLSAGDAHRFWTRLSIDLQRANHRAWERRVDAARGVPVLDDAGSSLNSALHGLHRLEGVSTEHFMTFRHLI